MDIFADFVMLVVPKVGQESARWKYDARKSEKTLTVYRLSYHDQAAEVSDCLSLQFCTEPSNPFTYSLIPTFTSKGNKRDTSFVQDLLGKSVLTSAAEVQKLLDCLDSEDQESDNDLALHVDETETEQASHYPPFFEREGSLGSDACSWEDVEKGHSDATSDSDFVVKTESRIEKKLKDRRTWLRRSARNAPVEPEMPVKRARKRKRRTEEPEIGVKKMKKNGLRKRSQSSKKGKHSEVQGLVDLIVFEDIPSPPQHPTSGGTILSSQYWTTPGEDRTRLDCTKHIFVDNEILSSLPHLSAVSPEELFIESVKYGWSLVEHLLGGSEAISRSFAYVSSGTCPIEKEELMEIVVQLCDAVCEHMQRSFHIDRVGEVGKAVMVVLKPKMELRYKELGSTNACPSHTRQPSDVLLKGHLKQSSYPVPGKVQLAQGFDFYVDGDKLLEIEGRCREDALQGRRCGIFAMDVVAELIGGLDVFFEGRKQTYRGGTVLLGDDIFEALFLRARKTLDLDDTIALKEFRAFVQKHRSNRDQRKIQTGGNTSLMASVLFRSEIDPSFGACSNVDPPAKLGHNYWTAAAPHRTALTPSSAFYVDKTKLAEYQRYFGPESTKKLVHCWPAYLKALVQHVAGGEESYMRALLDIRKTDPGSSVLDPVLLDDVFEHMVLLYKSPNVVKPRARIALLRFNSHQLELYDKGTTRWHFPDLDDRPKPEALVLLEEQEYWRKPAPDRIQLRPGHEVYIRTKILESIASYFGPQSKENCIKQYSYAVLAHMMGGVETALKLKAARTFADGVRSMFLFDDVIAVALHADEVFHLRFSVNPSDIITYTGVKLVRLTESRTRNRKRPTGRSRRKREPKNLLHFALRVT